ncbi:hypothetical protein ABPG77_003260 [Micractinium sp. CCAP 211/92]
MEASEVPAVENGHAASIEELASEPRSDPYDPAPRQGYLSWDDYFMAVAFLSAQRSKDPNKQASWVGACIVDQNNVICGIGYNGFPRGCADSQLPWAKKSARGDPLDTKYPYVCHAEMNAILNKNGASVAGARVYVTMFPCNECAKLMIQAGISEVVFHEAKDQPPRSDSPLITASFNRDQQYAASRRLLALAGVKLRQHLFRRPVLLRLTNDSKRPAVMAALAATTCSGSGSPGEGDAEPAPAIAAALQRGAALPNGAANGHPPDRPAGSVGSSEGSSAKVAAAAAAAAVAGGSAAAAGQARRRRGRRQGSQAAARVTEH